MTWCAGPDLRTCPGRGRKAEASGRERPRHSGGGLHINVKPTAYDAHRAWPGGNSRDTVLTAHVQSMDRAKKDSRSEEEERHTMPVKGNHSATSSAAVEHSSE